MATLFLSLFAYDREKDARTPYREYVSIYFRDESGFWAVQQIISGQELTENASRSGPKAVLFGDSAFIDTALL